VQSRLTHLDHAKTLLVVSSGDFEDVTREFITEAFALNSLQDGIKSSSFNSTIANTIKTSVRISMNASMPD
jgi:hypothetical protein